MQRYAHTDAMILLKSQSSAEHVMNSHSMLGGIFMQTIVRCAIMGSH